MDWREACEEDVLISIGWLCDWARAHRNDEYMGTACKPCLCVVARAIIRKWEIPETVLVFVSPDGVTFVDTTLPEDYLSRNVRVELSEDVQRLILALDSVHTAGDEIVGRTVKAVLNGMGYFVQ